MINDLLNFISIEFTVMLTAALPIIELKGAIPVGISLGLSPIHAFIISFIGSMIPVPFILFTIRPVFKHLKKTKMFRDMIHRLTDKSLRKSGNIQKYGIWDYLFSLLSHYRERVYGQEALLHHFLIWIKKSLFSNKCYINLGQAKKKRKCCSNQYVRIFK